MAVEKQIALNGQQMEDVFLRQSKGQIVNYTTANKPTPAAFGTGPIWIDGVQYWSDGVKIAPKVKSPVLKFNNRRNLADRASADQYIDFATNNPAVVLAANSDNPSITVGAGTVECNATGTTTGTNKFCGVSVSGTWDFSATQTYIGGSPDTIFLLDVELPEMPNGNIMQYSTSVTVFMATGTNFANNFKITDLLATSLKGGRELIGFKASDFITTGTPSLANINRIDVRINNPLQTNEPIKAIVRGLYVNVKRKPRLVLSFDNAHTSWYENFYLPYIKPLGWGCSQGAVSDRVGNGGVMTVAQLQECQDSGCEMFNHTEFHPKAAEYVKKVTITGTGPWVINYNQVAHGRSTGDVINVFASSRAIVNGLKTITVIDADNYTATETVNNDVSVGVTPNMPVYVDNPLWSDATLLNCRKFLNDNGLYESPVFVYPGGYSTPYTWKQLERLGFTAARAVGGGGAPVSTYNNHYGYMSNKWRIPSLEFNSTKTAVGLLAEIDAVLHTGADCHLYGHSFVASPTVLTEFPAAELPALVAGIESRIASGLIDKPISLGESIEEF